MDPEGVRDVLSSSITRAFLRKKADQVVRGLRLPRTELDDVVQELALTLIRRLERFDPSRGPLGAYIKTVVTSRAQTLYRSGLLGKRRRLVVDTDLVEGQVGGVSREPDHALRDLLVRVSEDIGPFAWRAILLVGEGGASHAARSLGVSRDKVRAIVRMVRDRICLENDPDFSQPGNGSST